MDLLFWIQCQIKALLVLRASLVYPALLFQINRELLFFARKSGIPFKQLRLLANLKCLEINNLSFKPQ